MAATVLFAAVVYAVSSPHTLLPFNLAPILTGPLTADQSFFLDRYICGEHLARDVVRLVLLFGYQLATRSQPTSPGTYPSDCERPEE